MSTVATLLETNVAKPASASSDAGSVTQHRLGEQILVDKYLSSKDNATQSHRGILFTKLKAPGAV